MYRLGQMFTATEFTRHYKRIVQLLSYQPQPLVITQKNGDKFIFVNEVIFEDLIQSKLQADGISLPPLSIREQILTSRA